MQARFAPIQGAFVAEKLARRLKFVGTIGALVGAYEFKFEAARRAARR
jgi:hypothetical protein